MIYLEFVPLTEKGILKKIDSQIKALIKLGVTVDRLEIKNKKLYLKNIQIGSIFEKNTILSKILRKIAIIKYIFNLKNEEIYKNKNMIYIRNFGSSPWMIGYLKFLKKKKIKIILEIPTYPYDNECTKFNIFYIMDKIYRKKLFNYVDRIVTYSEDREIWKIPCINISNGIDLDEIKIKNTPSNKKSIVITSVSNCSFWHGIDRMLNSLHNYYEKGGKEKIIFNVVGEGPELKILRKIVLQSDYLVQKVVFHGFKIKEELDQIYDETDIGIGCLGNHRKGLYTIQALKNKEYMAKGLPMIFSEDDPGLRGKEFVYRCSYDEKLIDILEMIKWYRNLDLTSEEIRENAIAFSWDIQMKKVVDEIVNNK